MAPAGSRLCAHRHLPCSSIPQPEAKPDTSKFSNPSPCCTPDSGDLPPRFHLTGPFAAVLCQSLKIAHLKTNKKPILLTSRLCFTLHRQSSRKSCIFSSPTQLPSCLGKVPQPLPPSLAQFLLDFLPPLSLAASFLYSLLEAGLLRAPSWVQVPF